MTKSPVQASLVQQVLEGLHENTVLCPSEGNASALRHISKGELRVRTMPKMV
jgi:hypothetical protein